MKVIDCEQGSEAWLEARIGVPTSSRFSSILTPSTMKPSKSQPSYLAELVAEWFLGRPCDDALTGFMERGVRLEPKARAWYAWETGRKVMQVGLCLSDDGSYGASPDSLVDDDGCLEVKCLSAKAHIAMILADTPDIADYKCQVQGQLLVTGRKWVDLVFYNPVFPSRVVRVEPDDKFLASLASGLGDFLSRLAAAKERLASARSEYWASFQDNDVPAGIC